MTLRTKTLSIVGVTLLTLIGSIYLVTSVLLTNSFLRLEKTTVEQNVSRVTQAINDEIEGVLGFTGDYSDWDETVNFVQDGNQEYIDSNLAGVTFENLKINNFIFLNREGTLIWGFGYDLKTQEFRPLSEELKARLKPGDVLLDRKDHDDTLAGLFMQKDWPSMLVSRPLMNSEGEGEVEGTVIIGRDLDDARIEKISNQTHLKFSVQRLDKPLPQEFTNAKSELTVDKPILVKPIDGSITAGYTVLNDMFGEPAIMLRVDVPRDVYGQGTRTIRYFLYTLVGLGLAFVLVVLLLLEFLVLRRLGRLSRDVKNIGDSSDFAARVQSKGNDELGDLSTTINWMLAVLQDSQQELQQEKSSVEEKVKQRTKELHDKAEELMKAKVEIETLYKHDREVEELKNQFVTISSHELRTPLTSIQGYAEFLKNESLPDSANRYIEGLLQGIKRLADLSQELINIASIEKGQIRPMLKPTDVQQLVGGICDEYKLATQVKGIGISCDFQTAKLPMLMVDGRLLKQAINNLVDNAVKFTKKGGVEVEAVYTEQTLRVTIKDTGSGIPKEEMHMLFQRFGKIDGPAFVEGKGLGLYLSRLIIEGHGGDIQVSSSSKGSTFIVTIPAKPA